MRERALEEIELEGLCWKYVREY